MRFEFKPSFDRSVKALHSKEKEEVKSIAIQTIDILSHDRMIYKGLSMYLAPHRNQEKPYQSRPRCIKEKIIAVNKKSKS